MTEEILVNVTPRETRVAVVENGMLQELHIERGWSRGVVGNIYKGRVQRVMPGMQAAFVEIGLDRAAFLHAATDALVSVAVVIGGLLILWLGWRWIDPALTLLISAVIVWHVLRDIGPVWRTMMLGAPPGFDTPALRRALAQVPGVAGVHHLHLWQIDERRISAEMHVVLAEGASPRAVRLAVREALARHGISHSTIETETAAEGCADLADPHAAHGDDHHHDDHDDHDGHDHDDHHHDGQDHAPPLR